MPTTVIIGAGISGLQCAAAFLRLGHSVTVLEKSDDVGGAWLRYTAFTIRVPFEFFQLPDFPCPPELQSPDECPTGRSLLRYIIAYAHRHNLYRHVIFRATVTRLHRLGGAWQCYYDLAPGGGLGAGGGFGGGGGRGGGGEEAPVQHRIAADFVVVATGLHNALNVPAIESPYLFRGRVLHVQDVPQDDAELEAMVSGCRVAVVGGTKTAVDVALRAARAGG
ncbi:hypothetical protein GPECTOR_9g625 [Gonium pectorale]|uniref:indole-3-pyruvate monooxygenase n=1 Tax=Gonium pectorale TaxID=33097 RepID=A0A150GS08_GONPE|nr:hypothetical protein GPECTOR_9g625 [Gonium pectorale]|eukprot:KXZ52581.1 hypothetical protein GPECTOR_9g625 [Gonium pectorale]